MGADIRECLEPRKDNIRSNCEEELTQSANNQKVKAGPSVIGGFAVQPNPGPKVGVPKLNPMKMKAGHMTQ